jgi:molecular chaperone HscB
MFIIDTADLDRRFRALQAVLHPDRHAAASEAVRRAAADASALVNRAYNCLRQPLTRGLYILCLCADEAHPSGPSARIGHPAAGAQETLTAALAGVNVDVDFLGELMELNEELAAASSEQAAAAIGATARARADAIYKLVEKDVASRDWLSARCHLVEARYLENTVAAVRDWAPGRRLTIHHGNL